MSLNNIQIYSIEGNIGSGKSTCISELKNILVDTELVKYYYLHEPVEIWNNIKDTNNINILTKFYADQEKYSFSFQMMAYISRLVQIKNLINKVIVNDLKNDKQIKHLIITERSLFTDKNVFAKMLFDSNKIDEINYQIYNMWFFNFIDEMPKIKHIYIQTDPKIAYERILKRNREGEKLTLEYIENCSKYHDNWLNDNLNCSFINGNRDLNNVVFDVSLKIVL